MPGPFWLPDDVREGDYIEIGMLGAYGVAMTTRFNGYGDTETVEVADAPMASMFGLAQRSIPPAARARKRSPQGRPPVAAQGQQAPRKQPPLALVDSRTTCRHLRGATGRLGLASVPLPRPSLRPGLA